MTILDKRRWPHRLVVVLSSVVGATFFLVVGSSRLSAQGLVPTPGTPGGLRATTPSGYPSIGKSLARKRFELIEPSGRVSGVVSVSAGHLIANDAGGLRYVFLRDRQFDSFDGRFIGYWHPSLNNVVRFPRSGFGRMQMTDLDDVFPQFTYSRRRVRPLGKGGGRFVLGPPTLYFTPTVTPYWRYPLHGSGYGHGYWYPNQSIVLESTLVPRLPLEPVDVVLKNSAPWEIRVTIADKNSPQTQMIRIAPGAGETVRFQRDAGADWVQVVQTITLDGSVATREIKTPVAPTPRYELVVHEWRLQSVAIDRTGKSPNVIEDTQFQGRGLGRFQLPAGDGLQSGVIDVVQSARSANNAGSVSPMIEESGRSLNSPRPSRPVSSLEQMILQQQRAAAGKN